MYISFFLATPQNDVREKDGRRQVLAGHCPGHRLSSQPLNEAARKHRRNEQGTSPPLRSGAPPCPGVNLLA